MKNSAIPDINNKFSFFKGILFFLFIGLGTNIYSITYYIDAQGGNDENTGLSIEQAWKSFANTGALRLGPGDSLLLKRGSQFSQQLKINQASGTLADIAFLGTYGEGNMPVITPATGMAVVINDCNYLTIKDLEITKNGVDVPPVQSATVRYNDGIVFDNLYIHNVSGQGMSLNYLYKGTYNSKIRNSIIRNCRIEETNQNGIVVDDGVNITITENTMDMIGQNGYRITQGSNITLRGNTVNRPGRTKPAGDGGYVMGCNGVLIERNVFSNSRGDLDACGFHIDVNNKNVVLQHNLSLNNEGGFVEILGDNYNCAFRYNVSINDGSRVKGVVNDHGDVNVNDGHILFVTGFKVTGGFSGPFNTYIYNNTIYTKSDLTGTFELRYTINGIFIANNIFHLTGPTKNPTGARKAAEPVGVLPQNAVFKHNVYLSSTTLPAGMLITDSEKIIGNAGFANPGGTNAVDYIPTNIDLIVDRSIPITKIPGDLTGLTIGFTVDKDFLGNPISGIPDIGAIESSSLNTGESAKLSEEKPNGFNVYPNITENIIKVKLNDFHSRRFYISNFNGKIVKTGTIYQEDEINLAELPGGLYNLNIEGYKMVEKIIKY